MDSRSPSPPSFAESRRVQLISAASYLISIVGLVTQLYSAPLYWKQPYHTSILTGQGWVNELIHGHPDRIWNELGMRLHVYLFFVHELRTICGLTDSRRGVSVEEQAAIFLYMCVTGLSVRHVAERFQRSNDTISRYVIVVYSWMVSYSVTLCPRYFRLVLRAVSSGPFYGKYVTLPKANDPIHEIISSNPKFAPYFSNALGAIDGTHINCCPSTEERAAARNRKGGVTQNCLAAVSFDMRFLYVLSGWMGSTADATMWSHSRDVDFRIPDGKLYLADAGFGICDTLLVPYRGVRYHLAEWGRANQR